MSNQIKPVLVSDPLLMLEDSVNFAVYRGGQNVSVQKFPATSATATAQQYQIQVPSLSTVIDRAIIWGSDITFTVEGVPDISGTYLINYGYTDVVAPFPLNNLCTNMNIQINNTSVSLPVNQVLDPLLRSIDSESIALWQGSTPTQLDYWGNYQDIADIYEANPNNTVNSSAFNGYSLSFNRREPPRGAFPVVISGNQETTDASQARTAVITISVREPLFVSPFIYESPEGHSGMSGVTQINITAQMDGLAKRALRWFQTTACPWSTKAVTNVQYTNAYMECKFLTAKPSDLIPSTIITPMYNLQNYITPANNNPLVSPTFSTTLTSNSIQINSIPDKVFVFVRQAQANLNNETPDVYCKINNIKITFGNQSGICSNFTVEDLHRASLLAGSKQTYLDFTGTALNNQRNSSEGTNSDLFVTTVGSVLCLNFGESINIPEDYFAPGSLSTTQFQITLDVTWTGDETVPFIPELNCMFMTSGVFSCNNGSSASYTSGVLSKQVVLDANASEPVNKAELSRLVGGGLLSSLKTMAHSLMPKLHRVVKQHGQNAANALLHEAVSAVGLAPVKRHRLKRM